MWRPTMIILYFMWRSMCILRYVGLVYLYAYSALYEFKYLLVRTQN